MVREPNVRMCGWDCKPVLRRPQTVCLPFAANQNLSVFCANTKRTGCVRCPFHTPDVLCSPQVRGKLINHALLTCQTLIVQHVSSTLKYTKLYITVLRYMSISTFRQNIADHQFWSVVSFTAVALHHVGFCKFLT